MRGKNSAVTSVKAVAPNVQGIIAFFTAMYWQKNKTTKSQLQSAKNDKAIKRISFY